jgi:hypothetical protein
LIIATTHATAEPLVRAVPDPPLGRLDLDPEFYAALSRWTLDNPINSDQLVDQIFSVVGDGTALLCLVPDSPFSIRTLIGVLVNFVRVSTVCRFRGSSCTYTQL